MICFTLTVIILLFNCCVNCENSMKGSKNDGLIRSSLFGFTTVEAYYVPNAPSRSLVLLNGGSPISTRLRTLSKIFFPIKMIQPAVNCGPTPPCSACPGSVPETSPGYDDYGPVIDTDLPTDQPDQADPASETGGSNYLTRKVSVKVQRNRVIRLPGTNLLLTRPMIDYQPRSERSKSTASFGRSRHQVNRVKFSEKSAPLMGQYDIRQTTSKPKAKVTLQRTRLRSLEIRSQRKRQSLFYSRN